MSEPSERFRFYLIEGGTARPDLPEPVTRDRPRPGHGTVFVRDIDDGTWCASWQDDAGLDDFEGGREAALDWARTRPAEQVLILDKTHDRWVPL